MVARNFTQAIMGQGGTHKENSEKEGNGNREFEYMVSQMIREEMGRINTQR